MTADSGRTIARGTFWSVVDLLFGRIASFVIIVVLARLLSPEQFGTVALLAVFIALANVLVESGFAQALIQRQTLADEDISTAFWITVVTSLVSALALFVAAPLIARFFDNDVLVPLARIMSLGVLIGAFGIVQRALLVRNMMFGKLLAVRIIASLCAGAVAITLAVRGYGVYALAAQLVVDASVSSLALWLASRWRPRAVFRADAARSMFNFGGYMLASTLLETIFSRAYTVLLGKADGAASVGEYARAESTSALATSLTAYPLGRVSFPAFSRMSEDASQLAPAVRAALRKSMAINAPVLAGLAAVAHPFVDTVYGPQWVMTAPILQILCLAGILMPVHTVNLMALMSIGRSDVFFRLELLKKAVGLIALVVALQWGAIGIAWAIVATGVASAWINTRLAHRYLGYGALEQLRDILPMLAAAGAMTAAVVTVVAQMPDATSPVRLAVGVAVGAIVYLGVAVPLNLGDFRSLLRKPAP